MDERARKIRLGLLLQGCVEHALGRTDYAFAVTEEYAPEAMEPDFLVPNTEDPDHVVEVTQTDSEDSFRMKTLRYFEAVCNVKAHFGAEVISVNVLMGNPEDELPEANVDALCGFFDANLIPRNDTNDSRKRGLLADLEAEADDLAQDEDVDEVGPEVPNLVDDHEEAIDVLSEMLGETLQDAEVKDTLIPVWENEEKRVKELGDVDGDLPAAPPYKRPILQSLYLTDDHFEELLDKQDPNQVSEELQDQLRATELVEERDTVGGSRLVLKEGFRSFVAREDEAQELRGLCEDRLQEDEAMHWFFQDIRDQERRKWMAEVLTDLAEKGRDHLYQAFEESLRNGTYAGIEHDRCWIADLIPLAVGESHTSFSRRMYQHPEYEQSLGNPYRNLTIRSARVMSDPDSLPDYARVAVLCFYDALEESEMSTEVDDLAQKLLDLRITGAIRLQRLNPLYLVIESVCEDRGFDHSYGSVDNILSDLAGGQGAVGKFQLNKIQTGEKEILVNALWVDEYGGLDKAKEWSARGRSFPYRLTDDGIEQEDRKLVLIADGPWKTEAVRRFRSGGWRVCRLDDFREVVDEIASLEG